MTIFLSLAGLIYTMILSIIFFTKKKIKSFEIRIYSIIIVISIISLVIELSIPFIELMNLLVVRDIFMKLFLVCILLWTAFFMLYVFSISQKNILSKYKIETATIYIFVNLIAALVIILLPIEFYKNGNIAFSYGPSINFLYVITGIYSLIIMAMVIIDFKHIRSKKYLPVYVLIILLIISALIQKSRPEILIINFTYSVVIYIMYFTIENPDLKLINELELAKNQAEKANQAKTDFLSSMSHEIRTPLNAIVGLSEIIKNSDDLNEIHEDANDVVNASNTLLEIVNGILDISKIEANKMEIIETIYSPQEEFNSLSKLVETRIGEKDIEFKTNLALDLPEYLYGDKGKIKQIIMNLLTNAVKYTEKGHIDFKVMCVNENNNCNLTIMVKDTGRGIKKEQIDKLFTKFNRLDEDKNTTLEGTGLGLAITKSLIEMMGGKIVVDSTYGKGSKFTVFIKQKISDKELKENHSTIRNTFENKRVLLVDDNKLNLKVATKILSEYKLNIDCCESGYECLEKINNNEKYDLIFMDIMMPKLNGIETFKKLKELKNFNTPVVALTADALGEQVNKYKESGFSEYLAKPIEKEELTKVLNNVFNNGSEEYSEEKIHQVIPITDEEIELLNKKVNRSKKKKVSNKGNVDYLKENNVDIETSLSLLGSMEMYNETLKLFVEENKTRIPRIEKNKHSQNMKDYSIDVHALKSDCKYLGFKKLAELSLEHELKSKEDNIDYVNKHFDELMDEYNKVEKIINNYL